MQVSVIIVNFNTRELLRNCLNSIYSQTKDISFEVIVSDNGSVDGSVEMLRSDFPQVILVDNKANLGFGTANNKGLDVAKGEFVFYLNSDTLLLNNAIKIFYDYWKQHESEQLGALGCNLVDGENKVSHSYGYFPNAFIVFRRLVHHLLTFYRLNFLKLLHVDVSKDCKAGNYKYYCGDVDYVTGADLFVKNDAAFRFDENFFLYYEETDMEFRMSQKGLRRLIIEGPRVMHLVRGGVRKEDEVVHYGSFSIIQSEISKVRYVKKHLSKSVAFLLKLLISAQWASPYIFKNTKKHFKTLWRV